MDNSKELYIVTGAAGNLGSAIVRKLISDGKDVRAFVLRGEEAAKHLPAEAAVIEGDVTDISSLETLFADIPEGAETFVIHCAAMVSVSNLVADKIWHVNVDGTKYIVDKCREHGARLVFISSTGAIPELPMGQAMTEVDSYDPNAVIGLYDQTKAAASQLVLDAIHAGEIDGCLILPSGISGPGDYTFGNVAGVIKEYVEGKMPAGVEGTFNCADNRDMAETIIRACRYGRSGESYILSGDCISMKAVFDVLAERTGLPTIKTILPAGMGKFLGRMSDIAETVTHKPQRMTSFAVYNLVRNNEFDSSKAAEELGYSPRPMVQSIAEEIDWMLSDGIVTLPEPDTRTTGKKIADANRELGRDLTEGFEKLSGGVVSGYKVIETGVVSGYKAIETGAVNGYKAIEDGFVDAFLKRDGETVEEAEARMSAQHAPAAAEDPSSVSDSYDNTDELIRRFPVLAPTAVESRMEKRIQNRLLNGFENWNRGFDAWKAWGDILYTPESMYNVHGVRLTLPEYQRAMSATLRANDIRMGAFRSMIINDDWAAIRYDITTVSRETGVATPGSVMEFVNFSDYGEDLGVRVVEGWAGTKGPDYDGLMMMLTPEEKEAQAKAMEEITAHEIPSVDVLAVRYPVKHPTSIRTALGREIREALLLDFESWNRGFDEWERWGTRYVDAGFVCHTDFGDADWAAYHNGAKEWMEQKNTKRVYFDNLLVRDNWAAVHYRTVSEVNGSKEAGSIMQFFRFVETEEGVKIAEVWNK